MDILNWCIGGFVALTVLLESCTDSLKFWTWLLRKIGGVMNKPLEDKLDAMETKLDKHIKDDTEDSMRRARVMILSFAADSRRGVLHTEEQFNNVLLAIDDYEAYCAEHKDFKNNQGIASIAYIKEIYAKCLEENSFLT